MKVAVLGAGAWGTALAMHVANKCRVTLWARDAGHISGMQKAQANPKYLGDFKFPKQLNLDDSLSNAINDADIIISAVPTFAFRKILIDIKEINDNATIIWANKGIEEDTAKFPHEVAIDILRTSESIERDFGVISGPSFAAELVRGLPTAVTLATAKEDTAVEVAKIFHHNNLRIYTSQDITGVSVGGALKNVIAIAAGISDGMGFGNNARAAIITRGLAEISRFGYALGANLDTFGGLTGAGDLFLTCTGEYSRNREVGIRLSQGKKIHDILKGLGHVAEGVFTAKEVINRGKQLNIDMPITQEVSNVIHNNKSPKLAVEDLLDRGLKTEY